MFMYAYAVERVECIFDGMVKWKEEWYIEIDIETYKTHIHDDIWVAKGNTFFRQCLISISFSKLEFCFVQNWVIDIFFEVFCLSVYISRSFIPLPFVGDELHILLFTFMFHHKKNQSTRVQFLYIYRWLSHWKNLCLEFIKKSHSFVPVIGKQKKKDVDIVLAFIIGPWNQYRKRWKNVLFPFIVSH